MALIMLCARPTDTPRNPVVLLAVSASPLYAAEEVCPPKERLGTESTALPPLSAMVPMITGFVVPSKNVTVPVASDGETLAVIVMPWPHGMTVSLTDSAIVEGLPPMVSVNTADVLLA